MNNVTKNDLYDTKEENINKKRYDINKKSTFLTKEIKRFILYFLLKWDKGWKREENANKEKTSCQSEQ